MLAAIPGDFAPSALFESYVCGAGFPALVASDFGADHPDASRLLAFGLDVHRDAGGWR